MTQNLTQTLNDVIGVSRYRGCLVWRVKDGWNVFGRLAKTKAEVDSIIDQHLQSLSKSIKA